MAFFPDGIPGLPMPRYFSNTPWLRTGRICTPLLSVSKSNRSPSRTPSRRRTSMGTVIWPLLVILACFCMAIPIPYFSIISLTWQNECGTLHAQFPTMPAPTPSQKFPQALKRGHILTTQRHEWNSCPSQNLKKWHFSAAYHAAPGQNKFKLGHYRGWPSGNCRANSRYNARRVAYKGCPHSMRSEEHTSE